MGEERDIDAHPDAAILTATFDGTRLLTGGDDGRLVATDAQGVMRELAHEKGKWIDALTSRADGTLAYAAGRQVFVREPKGSVKTITMAQTVRGLAFAPKGHRLAISQYNSVDLWFPNSSAAPDPLVWKGVHIDVTFSPDGRFIVSSMQDNNLHGWRIDDRKDMRMSGYPAKTRSFAWSQDGHWLATSGADACIVWPFAAKDGPMGKPPRECGVRPARVSRVAFHPRALVVAVGYEDGWILLCRLTDAAELLVRAQKAEDSQAAITALGWDKEGKRMLFGTQDGAAGILDLPA
ncbi:MAG: WD40 repeat domain-containing protein [Hyphomicrobiales bacterium]|nr:WD40 repeat domain-containing protein [Hyphomicrobiales bacterium]MDE2116171.1 WD40 repeat domain-containing protein [Hyphomicrobiales bacterium]